MITLLLLHTPPPQLELINDEQYVICLHNYEC